MAGLLAIAVVVDSCFAWQRIALDFRAVFAVTAAAFFLAGIARGSPERPRSRGQIVRICAPGLLGTAALVMNNGLHRLAMPIGLILIATFMVAAGVRVRRLGSLRTAAGAIARAAVAILTIIPRLSAYSAFDGQSRPKQPFNLSVEGRTLSSTDLQGRVVVLAFWTTWCSSCIPELPHLQRIYEHFRADSSCPFHFA